MWDWATCPLACFLGIDATSFCNSDKPEVGRIGTIFALNRVKRQDNVLVFHVGWRLEF